MPLHAAKYKHSLCPYVMHVKQPLRQGGLNCTGAYCSLCGWQQSPLGGCWYPVPAPGQAPAAIARPGEPAEPAKSNYAKRQAVINNPCVWGHGVVHWRSGREHVGACDRLHAANDAVLIYLQHTQTVQLLFVTQKPFQHELVTHTHNPNMQGLLLMLHCFHGFWIKRCCSDAATCLIAIANQYYMCVKIPAGRIPLHQMGHRRRW